MVRLTFCEEPGGGVFCLSFEQNIIRRCGFLTTCKYSPGGGAFCLRHTYACDCSPGGGVGTRHNRAERDPTVVWGWNARIGCAVVPGGAEFWLEPCTACSRIWDNGPFPHLHPPRINIRVDIGVRTQLTHITSSRRLTSASTAVESSLSRPDSTGVTDTHGHCMDKDDPQPLAVVARFSTATQPANSPIVEAYDTQSLKVVARFSQLNDTDSQRTVCGNK